MAQKIIDSIFFGLNGDVQHISQYFIINLLYLFKAAFHMFCFIVAICLKSIAISCRFFFHVVCAKRHKNQHNLAYRVLLVTMFFSFAYL